MPPTLDQLLAGLKLKAVSRAGWLRVGIVAPESVAAHSWGIAWLVLQLCPPDLDLGRALSLAVLHDLPEVRVGDITPHDGVSKAHKHALEAEAAQELFRDRPDLRALWLDYAESHSPEARFVRDLDKLDMALQALLYGHTGADTSEFVASAARAAKAPRVRALIAEIDARMSRVP